MMIRVRSKIERGHREAGKHWSREWVEVSEITNVMKTDSRLDIEVVEEVVAEPVAEPQAFPAPTTEVTSNYKAGKITRK